MISFPVWTALIILPNFISDFHLHSSCNVGFVGGIFPHLSKSATVASIYICTLCSAITHLWQERFTSNFLMLLKLSPKADRSDDEQHSHKIISLLLLFLSFMDLFPPSFAPWCRINMLKSKTISTVDCAEWRKKDFHVYLSSFLSPRFVLIHCFLTVLLSFF